MPADDTQSSSWGSSQRPASHLRRSLAAAGRRSTRQTRLRTSEWMHQGGTMAHQQVHRSRWIACRRRSAAPSITISRLSRGKTVEKCTGSRPARNKKSPSREGRRALHLANARIDARAQNLGDPSTAPCAGANADQLAPSAAECWACKRRAAPLLRTPVPKCPSAQKDCRERAPPPAPCAWPPAAPDVVEKSTNRDRRSAGVGRRFDLSRSFPRERVVPGVPQGACASSLMSEGQAS